MFKPEMDYQSISEFIASGYIANHGTAFKNIHSLKPGHRIIIKNKVILKKWWDIPSFKEKDKPTLENLEEKIENKILSSVKKRLISDTRMGIFLSGGLDSSLILAMIKKIGLPEGFKSYSLGFSEKSYDETGSSSYISSHFGVPNKKIVMEHTDFKNIFFDATIKADNLHSNPAMFANYYLAQVASSEIKVALSGLGGDELFLVTQHIELIFWLINCLGFLVCLLILQET